MKILAIGAHADDIELGCGGTLAKAIELGHQVKCIVLCPSGYKKFDGTLLRTDEEANRECQVGMRCLGVQDYNVLDFPNKSIPYDASSVEAIDKIMEDFKPDIIFTHWSFDTHQDHRNACLATISAARYFNSIFMYEPFPPSGRSFHPYRPQLYIDISNHCDKKIESIAAHESQVKKYGEDWLESVRGRASMRGNECGVKYAESFEIVRYKLDL